MLKKPCAGQRLGFRRTYIIIILCTLFGLLWSILPIFGWSHYSIEGAYTSCSVEWNERSLNVISYNITIFIFVFIIPLAAIVLSNLKVYLLVTRFHCN